MFASIQSVVHRWWTLLWSDGGALPATELPEAADESLPADSSPAAPEPAGASATKAELAAAAAAEAKMALAETVMRPVVMPAVVATINEAEIARRRTRTLAAMEKLRQIPALQSLAKGFLQAASREDVDLDEVVAAIGKDPALCVRVSRLANSAAIRPSGAIDDIKHSVQMLGVVRVRTLARALYTLRDSREIAPGFDWRHLWIHALATATLAEQIERRLGLSGDSVLYLSALLHDVGKIVLSVACPEEYGAVMVAAWNQSRPLDELERVQLGVSHREAGEIYLERSGLPPVVVSAALHHQRPGEAPDGHRRVVAVVALANHLSKAYGLGFSGSAQSTESETDFAELEAWKILEDETGQVFDRPTLETEIQAAIPGIKAELRALRDTGS